MGIPTAAAQTHVQKIMRFPAALLLATLLHATLLLLPGWQAPETNEQSRTRPITLSINDSQIQESPPRVLNPEPVPQIRPAIASNIPVTEATEAEPVNEEPESTSEPISLAQLEAHIASETESLLKHPSRELNAFQASFTEEKKQTVARFESFGNQYGEVHVVQKLGNQTVCYLQNDQFVDDDFGFNLVMFYACDNEQEMVLDIK